MRKLVLVLGLIFAAAGPASAADKPGCTDSSLVDRFAEASLIDCGAVLREDASLIVKPFDPKSAREDLLKVAGAAETRVYANPPERSALEINRYYEAALLADGAQILFSCARDACGANGRAEALVKDRAEALTGEYADRMRAEPEDMRYVAVRLRGGKGYLWVMSVYSPKDRRAYTVLRTIAPPAASVGPGVISAEALTLSLGVDGHVPLYSLQFDDDKASLKPDSSAQIDEIVKLLKNDPNLKVLIACHNDGLGADAKAIDLSRKRAEAVLAALVKAGIKPDRLSAQGVGAAAPLTSNHDDAGRARNRRVELVERLD